MWPRRSQRRSSRLLASNQAQPRSTTQRMEPSPDPCGSPTLRMHGWMPSRRQRSRFSALSLAASAYSLPMAAQTIGPGAGDAGRGGCHGDVGRRGDGAQRDTVGRGDDMVLGPGLAAVGGVGAGQLAAAPGPDRAAVDHHVPGRGLGSRAHHPDQGEMNPAQQRRGPPIVQATAQGGAAGAPGRGPRLAPLHPRTDEEPQRLDDLDGRRGRSSGAKRSALDPVDDPPPPILSPSPPCAPPSAKGMGNGRALCWMPKGRQGYQGSENRL